MHTKSAITQYEYDNSILRCGCTIYMELYTSIAAWPLTNTDLLLSPT